MSELRKDSLSFMEVIGQSVANVSPTFTPAFAVTVVAGMAGSAAWLVYVLATISLVIVGLNVGKLASRIPSAGSFFIYASRALGPSYGLLAGWAMLAAYLFTAMAITVATSVFIKNVLTTMGLTTMPPNWVLYAIVSGLVWVFATRDISISSRLGLALEGVSMVAILLVCLFIWSKNGFTVDAKQVSLQGADWKSVGPAIVFGIFSFVGFESAATLGKETRNPMKTVPKAVVISSLVAGLFFVFTTYILVLGFKDDAGKIGGSSAPLGDLLSGESPIFTVLLYAAASLSTFACALASVNAFSRILFSLGRYQFVHTSMGIVHAEHKTPHIAVTVGAALNFILCAGFFGLAETDAIGDYGTVATFGFVIVYGMCSIAAPVYLRKIGEAKMGDYVLGGLGTVLMALSLVGSVYPVPTGLPALLPYLFLAYMVIGAVWFFVLKARSPQIILGIEHDLEVAADAIKA